jgi:hypothetical protein
MAMKVTALASTAVVALIAGAWWAWPQAEGVHDPCGYIPAQAEVFANQSEHPAWKEHVANYQARWLKQCRARVAAGLSPEPRWGEP